jgi:hypothetical protein
MRKATALEQDVVMGTFTHTEEYLTPLIQSIRLFLPHIPFIIKVSNGPINSNMEALRQDFIGTRKRFWLFLDHDIAFLDDQIIHRAVADLMAHHCAMVGVYSTFDPGYQLGSDALEFKDVGWVPGYFQLVDSIAIGHISPDMRLPAPCTSVDTSYCVAARWEGYRIGISPSVVYHKWKAVVCNQEVVEKTNTYLTKRWPGGFYFKHVRHIPNIVGKMP